MKLLLAAIGLVAFFETPALGESPPIQVPVLKVFDIGSQPATCYYPLVGPQDCPLVQEVGSDDGFEPFYFGIEGFEPELGKEYRVVVVQTPYDPPLPDAPAVKTSLVSIVSADWVESVKQEGTFLVNVDNQSVDDLVTYIDVSGGVRPDYHIHKINDFSPYYREGFSGDTLTLKVEKDLRAKSIRVKEIIYPTKGERQRFIEISPTKQKCYYPMISEPIDCMGYRLIGERVAYQPLYFDIAGFSPQDNYYYVLQVEDVQMKYPLADAPSSETRLLRVVGKKRQD